MSVKIISTSALMMPGDDGGKRIVIAEVATLELIDRNGIVFVDDRNDVHIEQLTECIFHVAAADGLRGDIAVTRTCATF